MKLPLLSKRIEHLVRDRHLLFMLVFALLSLNFLQTIDHFFRSERVIIVPPNMSREFWIEKNRISPGYLEEMGLFFASLVLEISPESATYKHELLLRHAAAESYGSLKAQLLEDERRLKKERVVTSFRPNAVKVHPKTFSVEITGDLLRFVGDKRISQSRDTYFFTCVYRNSRLLIQSFKLLKGDTHA